MGMQVQAELYLEAFVPHAAVAKVGAPAASVRMAGR
jgi:hypothetical protein